MNSLFEFDGKNITINPILLSINEFEKLWKRDRTKDKSKARKEFIYIYGMTSNNIDNIWKDYATTPKQAANDGTIHNSYGHLHLTHSE